MRNGRKSKGFVNLSSFVAFDLQSVYFLRTELHDLLTQYYVFFAKLQESCEFLLTLQVQATTMLVSHRQNTALL